MVRFCFSKEYLREEMEEGVAEETPDGKSDHYGEGGGIDVGRAEGEKEVCGLIIFLAKLRRDTLIWEAYWVDLRCIMFLARH